MTTPEDLILLVGSNPLPNYVAAAQLRPKRIHLVCTPETATVEKRLKDCLRQKGLTVIDDSNYLLADATDVLQIRQLARKLPQNAGLHYTGGTKTM